ncbi:MAG: pyridoxal phosphate-dependent aminotransferase [Bacteroidales bacterium]|nr:pyridoxal phosphate-dependent aminotransferase [Bacteroidales bacterium]
MKYDFDKINDRRGTNSMKFDRLKEVFGKEDLLPMWVADMDFQSPPAVIDAIEKSAQHGIFGYSFRDSNSVDHFISWVKRRYNWDITPEQVGSSPGIVTALALSVRIFTKPTAKVLIQTPVYPPFHSLVKETGRTLVTSQIEMTPNGYSVNWEDFESKLASGVEMFILCNSHNPLGKMWSIEELLKMGNLCLKHGVLIFSDEIHADLALYGNQHIVMASVSEEIAMNTITAMAPSKTFNIAGLLNSLIISKSPELLNKFNSEINTLHLGMGNIFGHVTLGPAYKESEEWLNALATYIGENVDYAYDYLAKELPTVTFIKPESSFLLWLDFRKTGLSHKQIKEKLINQAKVGLNDGTAFGECGQGFFRMNIGARRAIIKEALERIVATFK